MAFSRRHMIRLGQAWLAMSAMPKGGFAAETAPDDLLTMSQKSFESLIGTEFTANSDSLQPTWLTLQLVENFGRAGTLGRSVTTSSLNAIATEEFALNFNGVGAALREGTYQLRHAKLGSISLFVSPTRTGYVAVVNHLLNPLPSNYQIPTQQHSKQGGATKA